MMLRAFTLIEMMVTLVVIGIVVSMLYVVLNYMFRNTYEFMSVSQENIYVKQFQNQLMDEVYHSESITGRKNHGFEINFYNGRISKYVVKDGYLFRKNKIQMDSIPIKSIEINYVQTEDAQAKNIIKNIHITAVIYDKPIPIYLFKNYYSRIFN